MKTIYVVQNGDSEPVLAFPDKQSAQYVAETNYSVMPTVYGIQLFEYDCATDAMMKEVDDEKTTA